MSVRKKKTFTEKLNEERGYPRVQPLEGKAAAKWGGDTILLPSALELDALMRKVPKGRVTTINQLRETLADRHGADVCCPIVAGIHARIAAGAAGEEEAAGKKRVTPYWRTLKAKGELNEKYPGGLDELRRRLEGEGHVVVEKGRKLLVADFEEKLARPT